MLSRLAEAQPDLDEAQNLRNRSDFVRLASAVAESLVEVEKKVLSTTPPAWLHRLIGLLHVTRTPVITFNYDTLLEAAVQSHELTDWESNSQYSKVTGADVLDHVPPLPPGRWAPEIHPTFRVFKLHGSLDWWWSAGDQSAATLVREPMFGGFGVPATVADGHLARQLVGRTRFIVPPMAIKSSYYANPVTRDLWQRAGLAVANARRVVLLGYSLPLTDLVVAGMVVDHLSADARVTVVNRDPAPVRRALESLGIDPLRVDEVGGEEAVSTFTTDWESEVATTLLSNLSFDDNLPLVAAWSHEHAAALVEAVIEQDSAVLVAEPPSPDIDPFRARNGSSRPPLTSNAVVSLARQARELRIRWHSGVEQPVVATAEIARETGHALKWQALIPAGGPLEAGYRPSDLGGS